MNFYGSNENKKKINTYSSSTDLEKLKSKLDKKNLDINSLGIGTTTAATNNYFNNY